MSDQHEHFNVTQVAGVLHATRLTSLRPRGSAKSSRVSSPSTESSCRFAREPSTP